MGTLATGNRGRTLRTLLAHSIGRLVVTNPVVNNGSCQNSDRPKTTSSSTFWQLLSPVREWRGRILTRCKLSSSLKRLKANRFEAEPLGVEALALMLGAPAENQLRANASRFFSIQIRRKTKCCRRGESFDLARFLKVRPMCGDFLPVVVQLLRVTPRGRSPALAPIGSAFFA